MMHTNAYTGSRNYAKLYFADFYSMHGMTTECDSITQLLARSSMSEVLMLQAFGVCHLSAHVSSRVIPQCIGMPFGVVSGLGLGSSVTDFGGDRRRGRGSLG